MGPFHIMTCGDSFYFKFLYIFERNVHERFGFFPIIYDLGLTKSQCASLRSEIRKINIPREFNQKNDHHYIKAIHKPVCVADALSKGSSDILYADADTIFISTFNPTELLKGDLAVTPRHPKERKKDYYSNGFINSGVIYFRNTTAIKDIISLWTLKCQSSDTTDQKALSDLLSLDINLLDSFGVCTWRGIKVLLLNPEIYNDVSCRTGKLFHFKNAGRMEKARLRYERFAYWQNLYPNAVEWLVTFNRRHRICVWRKKH